MFKKLAELELEPVILAGLTLKEDGQALEPVGDWFCIELARSTGSTLMHINVYLSRFISFSYLMYFYV